MKALTLWQPWAHIVAAGTKLVENRPWEPPHSLFDQRIAIHAGKKWDEEAAYRIYEIGGISLGRRDVIFGAVIATATLKFVVTSRDAAEREAGAGQGKWFFGPFGWILEDVEPVDPPDYCRGFQKLWNWPRLK